MTKARSPSYPSIGLRAAIEKVTAVYEKDAQNSIPREVVAKHAGFSGITGGSLAALASMLKFGLLTGRGDNTSVSDLAFQIIAHPEGSDERREAILQAAFSPALFSEIRDHFKSGKVSDPALRAYLLTRKFLPAAVDPVIRAYRETMALVDRESNGYTGNGDGLSPQLPGTEPVHPAPRQEPPAKGKLPPKATFNHEERQDPYKVTFTGGGIEIVGRIVSEADADTLIKAVTALKLLLQSPTRVQYPESVETEENE
jgi:hypothetical protein